MAHVAIMRAFAIKWNGLKQVVFWRFEVHCGWRRDKWARERCGCWGNLSGSVISFRSCWLSLYPNATASRLFLQRIH